MPPKKKNKPQAFLMFMQEIKKQKERDGHRFPNGIADVISIADPLWKELSPEDKAYYTQLAAKQKGEDAKDLTKKYTSFGISYAEVESERAKVQEAFNLMLATIKNTVNSLDYDSSFKEYKFYLCHVNFYYKNDRDVFKAAEIALSEFNLKNGLLNTFHRFVDSGKIEKGFRLEAKTQIDKTHQIPIEDRTWTRGERDYVKLLEDIKQFLLKDPRGRLPPIYTMPDNTNNNTSLRAVKSTLNTLCEAADDDPNQFKIYELQFLFHEIQKKAVSGSGFQNNDLHHSLFSVAMATSELEKDLFSYCKNLACDYHEERDIQIFCSKSIVTRWVFTICDFILQYIPDNVIPGKHVPIDSNTAKLSARVISPFPNESKPVPPKIKTEEKINVRMMNCRLSAPQEAERDLGSQKPAFTSPSAWSSGLPSSLVSFPRTSIKKEVPVPPGFSEPQSSLTVPPGFSELQSSLAGPSGISLTQSSSASSENNWQTMWGRGRGSQMGNSSQPIDWSLCAGRGYSRKSQQQ